MGVFAFVVPVQYVGIPVQPGNRRAVTLRHLQVDHALIPGKRRIENLEKSGTVLSRQSGKGDGIDLPCFAAFTLLLAGAGPSAWAAEPGPAKKPAEAKKKTGPPAKEDRLCSMPR